MRNNLGFLGLQVMFLLAGESENMFESSEAFEYLNNSSLFT